VTDDTLAFPLAVELLGCLCAEMPDTVGGDVCWCGLLPGQLVPMDYCQCEGTNCGQAWVRIVSVYPSQQFPRQSIDYRSCADPLAVELNAGVFRCFPGLDENLHPPTVDQQLEAVRVQMSDQAAIRRAIQCCFGTDKKRPAILGRYTPLGPAGDCGGGYWAVTVQAL